MGLVEGVKRWKEAISLCLICIVFASFQWEVLRGFVTEGPSVVNTPYEIALLVMLLITFGALVYEIRQTAST